MSKLANKHQNILFPFLFSLFLNLGNFLEREKGACPLKMHLGNFVRNLPFYFAFFLKIKSKIYSKYPEDTFLLIFYKSFFFFRGLGMTGMTGCRVPYKGQIVEIKGTNCRDKRDKLSR